MCTLNNADMCQDVLNVRDECTLTACSDLVPHVAYYGLSVLVKLVIGKRYIDIDIPAQSRYWWCCTGLSCGDAVGLAGTFLVSAKEVGPLSLAPPSPILRPHRLLESRMRCAHCP